MKTFTKKIGKKEVTITITRLPLQPGLPYRQSIVAVCGEHVVEHVISHDPTQFVAADVSREIDRISAELAAKAAGMDDVATFLDDYHAK
jgi:hypothetical protein